MDNIIEKNKKNKFTKIKNSQYKDIHKKKDINRLNSIKKNILIEDKQLDKLNILKNIDDLNTFINDIENIESNLKKTLNLEHIEKNMKYKIIKNNNDDIDNNSFDFLSQNDNIINLDFNSIYYGNSTNIFNLVNNLFIDSSNKNDELNININLKEYIGENVKDTNMYFKTIIINDLDDSIIDNDKNLLSPLSNLFTDKDKINLIFLSIKIFDKNSDKIKELKDILCNFNFINKTKEETCNIFLFIKIKGVNKIYKVSNEDSFLFEKLNEIDNKENIKILIIGNQENNSIYNNYLIKIYSLYKQIKEKELIQKQITIPLYNEVDISFFKKFNKFIEDSPDIEDTIGFMNNTEKLINENKTYKEFKKWYNTFTNLYNQNLNIFSSQEKNGVYLAPNNTTTLREYSDIINKLNKHTGQYVQYNDIIKDFFNILNQIIDEINIKQRQRQQYTRNTSSTNQNDILNSCIEILKENSKSNNLINRALEFIEVIKKKETTYNINIGYYNRFQKILFNNTNIKENKQTSQRQRFNPGSYSEYDPYSRY